MSEFEILKKDQSVENYPFPQNVDFENCIKPDHINCAQMNQDIIDYYNYWKTKYLKESKGNTPGGGYYIEMKGTGGDGNEITTSEAHGYGMITFALMAGNDPDAKKYFDGMFNMFDKHRSKGNSFLMSWVIHKTESTDHDSDSATDGDMDIAYALLLAHCQWGSSGEINYLRYALDIINHGIKVSDMSSSTKRAMLGDWDNDENSTRSSDWMTGHFFAYYAATGDTFWHDAHETAYWLINTMTKNHSLSTGLMPDFIVNSDPEPAPKYFLNEFKDTDQYNWNACRYPWRITADYAHYGTSQARESMMKILEWLTPKTDNNPGNIKAGYTLEGQPLNDISSGAFSAPLVTACIVDPQFQNYLNSGWDCIKSIRNDYFGDSITLLNMLLISGNWWKPLR